jgi:valyl-tRNA synthetase
MQPKPDQRTPPAGGNDLLQQAKQTTSEVVDQVQQQAGSRINRQKDEAAEEIHKVAGAVRQLGDQLGGQEQGPIAHYAAEYGKKAADGLERFTNYLRQTDSKALVNEIENLGRRQPVLLIGGAFLLGLAGARFLKSSKPVAESNMNLGRSLPPPPQQPAHVPTTSATL